jgi:NAD(P)-dependent dehydrogenase (short-subunit alcohol dehydrogenase family)
MDLCQDGQTAVVTGASRGIGLAIPRALAPRAYASPQAR